jgi:Mrp family chromosome partitioning ATPase
MGWAFSKKEELEDPVIKDPRDVFSDYVSSADFRRVFNQLVLAQDETGAKSITLLSAHEGEGRTFVTAALAIAFASLMRKKVAIVDTVSRSAYSSFFWNRIADQGEHSKFPGRIDLLLPASPDEPNAPPLFTSEDLTKPVPIDFHFREYLTPITAAHDVVLIDTCSIQMVKRESIHPLIAARQADAAIIVSSPESLERESLHRLKLDLKKAKVKLLGTIFNVGFGAGSEYE